MRNYRGRDKQGSCFWARIPGIEGGGCVFNNEKELLGIAQFCTAQAVMRVPTGSEVYTFNVFIEKITASSLRQETTSVPVEKLFAVVDTLPLLRRYAGSPSIAEVNIDALLANVHCIKEMEEIRSILAQYGATFTKEHFYHVNPSFYWYMIAQGVPYDYQLLRFLYTRADLGKGNVPYFCDWLLEKLSTGSSIERLTGVQYLELFCTLSRSVSHHFKDKNKEPFLARLNLLLDKVFSESKREEHEDKHLKTFIGRAFKLKSISARLLALIREHNWCLPLSCVLKVVKHAHKKECLSLGHDYPQFLEDIFFFCIKYRSESSRFATSSERTLIKSGSEKYMDALLGVFPQLKENTTLVTRILLELDEEEYNIAGILVNLHAKSFHVDSKLLNTVRNDYSAKVIKVIDLFLEENV